jgi:hypothetical protein
MQEANPLSRHGSDTHQIMSRLTRRAAPGGWVCIEAGMLVSSANPRHALHTCMGALITLVTELTSMDPCWVTTLPHLLAQTGLTNIGVTGTPGLVGGHSNADELIQLSLQQWVTRSLIDPTDLRRYISLLAEQEFTDIAFILFSA